MRDIVAATIANFSLMNVGIIWNFVETLTEGNLAISAWKEYILMLCVVLGFLCGAIMTDACGRKTTLIILNLPVIVNWALFKFSNRKLILVGYGLLYFNACAVLTPVLIYISEISRPKTRGGSLASGLLFVSLGAMLERCLRQHFPIRISIVLHCIAPILTFIAQFSLPESPHWLISKDKPAKAKENLSRLMPDAKHRELELHFRSLCKELGKTMDLWIENPQFVRNKKVEGLKLHRKSTWCLLKDKRFMQTLTLINFLAFVYNFSGVLALRLYHKNLLTAFGLAFSPNAFVLAFEGLQICGIVICIVYQRHLGHRILAITTTIALGVFNLALAVFSYMNDVNYSALTSNNSAVKYHVISLFLLIGMVVLVNSGLRSLAWVLRGELFEDRLKSCGASIAGICSYAIQQVFKLFFVKNVREFTLAGMFGFFAFLAFVCALFLKCNLLETEGKTLYKIQQCVKADRVDKRVDNEERSFDDNQLWHVICLDDLSL